MVHSSLSRFIPSVMRGEVLDNCSVDWNNSSFNVLRDNSSEIVVLKCNLDRTTHNFNGRTRYRGLGAVYVYETEVVCLECSTVRTFKCQQLTQIIPWTWSKIDISEYILSTHCEEKQRRFLGVGSGLGVFDIRDREVGELCGNVFIE